MSDVRRRASSVLTEIRTLAGLHFRHRPDVITTDHNGIIDGAWRDDGGTWRRVPRTVHHLRADHQATRLAALLRQYAAADPTVLRTEDHELIRVHRPSPRFPLCVELLLTPWAKHCPQCGANNGAGKGKLDGKLERWHDEEGSGWQCHNLTCLWQAVDGEDE